MLPQIAQLEFNLTSESTRVDNLGKSFKYDFLKGDFLLLDGKLVAVEDVQAIKVWVEKVLRTERFRFKIYERADRNEYGVTLEDLIGMVLPRAFVEEELKREITEAVTRHPQIESISDLCTEREDTWLTISFKINLTDGQTVQEEVVISG